MPLVRSLFASDIGRRIEEVIKVDQTGEDILRSEIDEYVATDAIRKHFTTVLEAYRETPNRPHEGIGVWVSGFFGSGKSSFAKILGLAVSNWQIHGTSAAVRLAERTGDPRITVLLRAIEEQIPTHPVIFDVSASAGVKAGSQKLTEILYRLFLQSLGYARELDLAELEIALEERGELDAFKAEYRRTFDKDWDKEKGKVAFALSEASRVCHQLAPATYPQADSWVRASRERADITPSLLAERCRDLMARRAPGESLLFVVDEVGQFAARDVQRMLDLQAVVQSLGRVGRGKFWLVVTSQEQLNEVVGGLDDKRVELARLMDRFPLQVHLEPSDISEVTSRRVLSKNADAQNLLGRLFDEHRGRLTEHTRLSADIRLPELSRQAFIDLYPLLPYQVDLIIQVVSGLRTQGGASRHVGGAARTIIKLAQQLLINPGVDLASVEVGALVRLDHVYDLVEGNLGGDIRAKITGIAKEVAHPLAQPVAKAICLLQYTKSIHRTAANIAAALHPGVGADSQLSAVKEALQQLEAAHKVRLGEDGYRIPTPAEDDWERTRMGVQPRPGDTSRLLAETLTAFWQPQPQHTLLETKTFKAGLSIHGREVVQGDIQFQVHFSQVGHEHEELVADLRSRSQQERRQVFWAVPLTEAIDRQTVELHRSKEILARKEREAKTADESALVAEEKHRLRRHQDELKRLLKAACLTGTVFFRGKDRSPDDGALDLPRAVQQVLGQALPEVFERFGEAAARVQRKDLDDLFTADSLKGLPPIFASLGLLRDENGQTVFRCDAGPLLEILSRIQERASYGDTASGRYLADEFAKEPFGWDFEVVRLLVVSLLRAGKIEATSQGQLLESATTVEARKSLGNNPVFRQAAFRPRSGGCEFEDILAASEHYRDVFGAEIKELQESIAAAAVREKLVAPEQAIQEVVLTLRQHSLPGVEQLQGALDQVRAVRTSRDCPALRAWSAAHRSIKDAIRHASALEQALTEPHLHDIDRARKALATAWPFLREEPDLDQNLSERAAKLEDLLRQEAFFRELPAIDQHARALEQDYAARYARALEERASAYEAALEVLMATPGWAELDEDARARIAAPLRRGAARDQKGVPIPQLRSERDACESRLSAAQGEVVRAREGERVVTVSVAGFFAGGIDSEEQLETALDGVRDECLRLIGAGKRVLVR